MPIPIFLYHQIDKPAGRGSPFRALTVDPRDFRRQMRWLKRLGFTGLSMRDLMPYLRGEKTGKVAGITFDDGFRNVFTNALPVLQELGFTATNYFVSRQIGGSNQWDAHLGVPYAPCMSKAEMLEWAALGHEVGSHTLDHTRLPSVASSEARRQITDSRHELEDMLGSAVDAFCYPHGGETHEIRQMVEDAGYTNATTVRRGRTRTQDDMLLLPRMNVRRQDSWLHFLRKCLTG